MKCQDCPIVGKCIAEHAGWEFACRFTQGSDAEKRWLVDRSDMATGKDISVVMTPYPSIAKQAGSVVTAVGQFVASGFKVADEAEQDRRLAICYICELWDGEQGRCRKCGCFGAWKAWVASQKCPLDKW